MIRARQAHVCDKEARSTVEDDHMIHRDSARGKRTPEAMATMTFYGAYKDGVE